MKGIASKIFGGAFLLGAVALISKLMGAFYRIPLTRILGAHGMGLYQSVFPSYALIVIVTGGGYVSAVSKHTAENGGKTDVASLSAAAVLFSLPVTVAALLLSRTIAAATGAPEAAGALAALLPSVPLSSVAAVMRGYFLGKNNVKASAFGQLAEQSVKLAAGLALAFWLSRFSLAAAVAGCAAGVSAGEAASLLYSYTAYHAAQRKTRGDSEEAQTADGGAANASAANVALATLAAQNTEASAELVPAAHDTAIARENTAFAAFKSLALSLMRVSLPITLSLTVLPLCQVADSFAVVNLLVRAGADSDTATKLYGLVTGPVNSLVNLPAIFTVGICGTLLPKISRLRASGGEIRSTVKRVLALSVCAGIIMGAGLAVASKPALFVLYGKSLGFELGFAAKLLALESIAVPFMTVSQCVSAVLQGAGKSFAATFGLLAAALLKETLNFVLLPTLGITGFVIATVAFYAAACASNAFALARLLRSKNY